MNHHVLAVPDKNVSANFFIDILGFKKIFENDGWIFVIKEDCQVMLGECRDAISPSKLGDHSYFSYFLVDNASDYFEEVKAKGATITSTLADKPWKMREFGIQTPDGFRIMVGQQIK
jgi:uncharacterized glyoxalase superfamily protein PhnB